MIPQGDGDGMDRISTHGGGHPSAAKRLVIAVRAVLDERFPGHRVPGYRLPDGLRLEIHPAAMNELYQDPETMGWDFGVKGISEAVGVPVMRNTGLRTGTWRLVIVTEDVLAETVL